MGSYQQSLTGIHPKTTVKGPTQAILVGLLFSIVSATGPQYVFSALAFLYLLVTKCWREPAIFAATHFKPPLLACLWFVGFTVGSALLSSVFHESASLATTAYEIYHLLGKGIMRGLAIFAFFAVVFYRGGFDSGKILRIWAGLLLLHLLYLILQRYTGVDWVKGMAATLPQERFNYGVFRASGMNGHPLSLAYNALLLGALALGQLAQGFKEKKESFFYIFLYVTALLTIVLAQGRFPLFLLVLLSLFWLFRTPLPRRWKRGLGVLVLVVSMGMVSGLWGRFAELFDSHRSLVDRAPRLVFWQVHGEMIKDHPLLGVGYAQRETARSDYYKSLGYGDFPRQYSAHNIYLQVFADSGLWGFLGLLGFLVLLTRWGLRERQRGDERLIYVMIAVWLSGCMQNTLRDSEFLFTFWVILAFIAFCPPSSLEPRRI